MSVVPSRQVARRLVARCNRIRNGHAHTGFKCCATVSQVHTLSASDCPTSCASNGSGYAPIGGQRVVCSCLRLDLLEPIRLQDNLHPETAYNERADHWGSPVYRYRNAAGRPLPRSPTGEEILARIAVPAREADGGTSVGSGAECRNETNGLSQPPQYRLPLQIRC